MVPTLGENTSTQSKPLPSEEREFELAPQIPRQ